MEIGIRWWYDSWNIYIYVCVYIYIVSEIIVLQNALTSIIILTHWSLGDVNEILEKYISSQF